MAKLFFVVAFCLWCLWIAVSGLKCLQCLDPKPNGPCVQDYMGLVNTSLEIFKNENNKPYYKECPNKTGEVVQEYCVIEAFYLGGELKSFIRDCSDGVNFSFTGEVQNNKLQQILPDNYTTCIYRLSANAHICLSLCQDDFCNAPRPPSNDTNSTELCANGTGDNLTCAASRLYFASGPFGPMADYVFGRAYLLPVLISILCVQIFG